MPHLCSPTRQLLNITYTCNTQLIRWELIAAEWILVMTRARVRVMRSFSLTRVHSLSILFFFFLPLNSSFFSLAVSCNPVSRFSWLRTTPYTYSNSTSACALTQPTLSRALTSPRCVGVARPSSDHEHECSQFKNNNNNKRKWRI